MSRYTISKDGFTAIAIWEADQSKLTIYTSDGEKIGEFTKKENANPDINYESVLIEHLRKDGYVIMPFS